MTITSTERPFGLLQLWDAVCDAVPERECIVQGARRLTWQQVRDRTTRLGWWLTSLGAGHRGDGVADWESPNDTVGLLLRNSPEYLEACLGAYRARCAPFNINYRYQVDELTHLLDDARPSVVIYHREFGPVLEQAVARALVDPVLVHVDDSSSSPALDGSTAFESALARATAPGVPVAPSPDDVHILYTGGTTGLPKGVLWRLRDLAGRPCGITVSSLEDARETAPRRAWLRALPAPPLMHGAAAWFAYGAWARGGTIVLGEQVAFDAEATLDLCERESVTWMAIVGDAFAQPLLEALERRQTAPGKLSYIFSSGAPLTKPAWSGLEGWFPGLKVVNALGSSETGPQAVQTDSGQEQFVAGPTTRVVSDDYGTLLTSMRPGEGWLASAGELPRGYLGDEQKTSQTFRTVEGVRLSVSGDRAHVDEDGQVTFLGRASSVINSGGEKIFAEEVQDVLLTLPEIQDALVLGRPSERWGQEVVAVVVAASGGKSLAVEEVRDRTRDILASYKLPRAVRWVERIPRFENGKADYARARSLFDQPVEDAALLAVGEEGRSRG